MNRTELLQLVDEVRSLRCELDTVEVKLASTKVPRRLFEVLSAFANSDEGGVIIFGIDEENDFEVVGVADAQKLQADVTSMAQDGMSPSLRPSFTVVSMEGHTVVGVRVPPLAPSRRPCYFKDSGLPKGAFIRVGNSNRQMSDYEVFGYVSNHDQPKDDEQTLGDADISDLDSVAVDAHLELLLKERPDAACARQSTRQGDGDASNSPRGRRGRATDIVRPAHVRRCAGDRRTAADDLLCPVPGHRRASLGTRR